MSLFGQSSGSSVPNTQQKPLFGSTTTSQPQPNTSIFGTTASSQPQASPSLFGSSASTTSQPQTGGLFGATASQPQQSGGLFGASSTQAQPTGGLFGSSAAASQPQQSGGLFGSAITPSQPQQSGGLFVNAASSQPQQAGGLFGATMTSVQPQTGQTGGLFGSTTNKSQPQSGGLLIPTATSQSQTGSLFGSTTQQGKGLFGGLQASQPQQSISLFGSSTSQTQPNNSLLSNTQTQQKSSLFGPSVQQPPSNSLFGSSARPGGLTMGQSTLQPQQQTVPAVKIDLSNIRGTTRFNELHDDIQKQIEQIDAFIQQQIQFKEQCDALLPTHQDNLSTIPTDVEFLASKLENAELAIDNDASAIARVRSIVQKDANDARIGFRAVENLKLPQQFHYSGVWQNMNSQAMTPPRMGGAADSASDHGKMDLLGFFDSTTSSLSQTLSTFESNLSEIENHLNVVERKISTQAQQVMFRRGKEGGTRSKDDQIRELGAVLREFEGAIAGAAERFGKTREGAVGLIEGEAASSNSRN